MRKKFQVNPISFTIEKVLLKVQRHGHDFLARFFQICTIGIKSLHCDLICKENEIFFSQSRAQRLRAYYL